MQRWAKRAARSTGVLTMAAGVALAVSTPASAAPPNTGTGLSATGLIPSNPLAVSTFPGTSPTHAANVDLSPLLTTGVADTAAGPMTASAAVSGLTVSFTPTAGLTAGALTSNCSYDPATGLVSGDSAIANGRILQRGRPIDLPPHAAPNTIIALPGLLATLTLNRQTTAPDGTLTVSALTMSLLGGLENVVVATSTCNAAVLS